MATNIWQATDGNWDTGSNWSLGVKPVNDDVIIFDGNVSQQSVTSGHTDETAITAGNIWVKESYRGDIGTAANPLAIGANSSAFTLMRGTGAVHLSRSNRVICDSPNVLDAISLYGTNGSAIVKRGKMILTSSHSTGSFSPVIIGGILQIDEAGATDDLTTIRQTGGFVICSRDWNTNGVELAMLAGGVWQQLKNGPDAGVLVVVAGSTVIWDAPGAAGKITLLDVHSGVIDFNNTGDEKELGVLQIYGGEVIKGSQVSVTSETDFRPDFPE